MATYLDKISAKIAEQDNEFLGDIQNEHLEHAIDILYKQQSFIDLICNYRLTQELRRDDVRQTIIELFSNTDSFIDIKIASYVVVSCLDDITYHCDMLISIITELQSPTCPLPKKHVLLFH